MSVFPDPIEECPRCFADNFRVHFERYGEDADGNRWIPMTICECVECGYIEEIRG